MTGEKFAMQVKKFGKTIYGAELTSAEKKALEIEVKRQLAEYTNAHELEIEAIVIRQLRRHTGWGERRLKRFYDDFSDELASLVEHYEMSEEDAPWLCTRELKEEGFDIKLWYQEKHSNEET